MKMKIMSETIRLRNYLLQLIVINYQEIILVATTIPTPLIMMPLHEHRNLATSHPPLVAFAALATMGSIIASFLRHCYDIGIILIDDNNPVGAIVKFTIVNNNNNNNNNNKINNFSGTI